MSADLYFLYAIGTVCGGHRSAYVVQGPMQVNEVDEADDHYREQGVWFPLAYVKYTREEVEDNKHPEATGPRNRREFYERAKGYLERNDWSCGGMDIAERDLLELEAWWKECGTEPTPPTKSKTLLVQEWGKNINREELAQRTWEATLALCKGA